MKLGLHMTGIILPLLLAVLSINGSPFVDNGGRTVAEITWPQLTPSSIRQLLENYDAEEIANQDVITEEEDSDSSPEFTDDGSLCSATGIFSITGSCRHYYQCAESSEKGLFSFRIISCTQGKIFDGLSNSCEYAYKTTSRPECLPMEDDNSIAYHNSNRQKRSASAPTAIATTPTANATTPTANATTLTANATTPTANTTTPTTIIEAPDTGNCTGDAAENMARSSEETCAHIGNVEDYVNLVMSMIPLEVYYENQEEFTQIFRNYDHDLLVAQGHAKIWRNGDSIVAGIRETFSLARLFEPEFKEKYDINQQRVEVIKDNADQVKIINATKDEIKDLEEQVASAIEAMNQVAIPAVQVYFEVTIAKLNATIEEKRRQLSEDFILINELEELADFLDFVRKDSDKIRAVALKTREKIETFRDNLEHDKGAFVRHSRVASETFDRLQNETIKNNQALEDNKKRQVQLEQKMDEERKQIKELYAEIHESHRKLREMRRDLIKKISKTNTLKIIGAVLTPVVVGAFLYNHAKKEEKKLSNLLQSTLAEGRVSIDALHSQVSNNQNELKFLQEQMANSTSNSEELRDELNDFITLDGDLKVMADKVETLLEAINKALVGVKVIKGVFDDVTKKLTDMIDLARSAKTEAEKLNAKFFIYNELDSLACNWNDVYINVMNLDECTKTFEILY